MIKHISLTLITISILFLSFSTGALLPIGSDMPMQDNKMLDISGKEVSMKDAMKGNGVVVIFSSNTCPYVIKNQDRITTLADFATKLNFGVIILNSNEAYRDKEESYEAMKEYAVENKMNCFYTVDKNSEVADAFGANRTPECFLFDKNMKLAYHGAIDDNPTDATAVTRRYLADAMTQLSNNKEVTMKESKSVGCGIKRKKV
ncbi:MAG: redoxin family protein [Bacteroidota bacterium]